MVYLRIFRLCLLILFFELLLIRWLSTEVSVLAYLQNSILVACFLGLGMGLISPRSDDNPSRCLFPLLLLTIPLSIPVLRDGVRNSSLGLSLFHDFLVWHGVSKLGVLDTVLLIFISLVIVFAILGACWAIMVPLGAELGRLFELAPKRLGAYSVDIFGSLVGVIAFTILAYLSLAPVWWFIGLGVLLLLQPSCRTLRSLCLLALVGIFLVVGNMTDAAQLTFWTPYQKLQFSPLPEEGEWEVTVNNSGYQQIQNNSALNSVPLLERPVQHYNLPARLSRPVRRALVVGAGTGNDVAGLLANSEAEILAVDIDPVLLSLGAELHPEHPYANPRVSLVENDARAIFLNEAPHSFDLIVFGLLDSHTTPNLSNARLDNFVYTLEALQSAKRLLSGDGILCIIFQLQRRYVGVRLQKLMAQVFGESPLMFHVPHTEYGWGGTAFVVGDLDRIRRNIASDTNLQEFLSANRMEVGDDTEAVPLTSDNWPYLYIERPSVPALFFVLGIMFLVLWIVSSYRRYGRLIAPDVRRREDVVFLMLGISFSLVQVFSINKASILFGSTWFVNSAVIAGILLMILLSNLLAAWLRPPFVWTGLGVCALTVGLGWFPMSMLLEYPMYTRAVIAGVVSGLPLLLSGILFASAFGVTTNPGRVLGANLFGAMVGGVLQLVTFRFGIASTIYLAAACYFVATLVGSRSVLPKLTRINSARSEA